MNRALRKMMSFIVLCAIALIALLLPCLISPYELSAAPPTQGASGGTTPEQAFQAALASYIQRTSPKVRLELAELKKKDRWAYAVAQAPQPHSELFVVLLARKDNDGRWVAIAPITSPAKVYNDLLKMFPSALIDDRTKVFMQQPESIEAISNFGGHKLPWASGQIGYVTQKDNCSPSGCAGSGHENQIDFDIGGAGTSGNVYASKPGTVVFVKESSNSGCGSLSCWQQANMVVIQHGTSEYSWYVHLAYNSVTVNVGDAVGFGRMIGVEGATGYASGVHLHYMASTSVPAWTNPNDPNVAPWPTGITPVDFAESSWSGLMPGQSYTSQNSGGGPPSGYTFCANEGQRCNFSGTKDVAYGANGSFYYKYNITGGIDCNNSVFGDPAYGVSKACYTKDSSQPPPPPPGQWHVEYFSDKNLGSRCYDGYENSVYIFKKWDGASPASGCPSDGFSARFTRTVNFQGGTYSFHLEHDDGARLFVDGQNLINTWWDGGGGHDGAKDLSGNHEVKIEYYENTGGAYIEAWWRGAGALPNDPANDLYQWRGDYYGNRDLSFRPPMTLNEGNGSLDKNWGSGSPGYGMPSDNFSVRWNRIAAFECGRYRFNVHADDGVRLWVNNQQLLNEWRDQVADFYPEADLPAGNLPIKVEYYESGGGAAIQVNWQKLSSCVTPPSAPTPITPPNGANNPYNYDLTFQWNAVSGASEYLIEWWGGPYSTMQPCGWSSNTSCHIGQVIPGNTYSWHVKARNSAGESGWSGTWTFTLKAKPPAANFDAWPQSGNAPLTVAMHIIDTSNLTSCSWDYGDGQTGTSCASNHEHTYTKAGTYTVRLDVSGPGGSDSMTRNNYIAVSSPPTDHWHVEFFNSFTPGSNRCFDGSNYGTYLFYYWRSEPPNQACSADNFSARFSKRVNFAGGAYQFHIDHDDGGRLYLDGSLIIDNWSYGSNDVTRNVTAGLHDVLYEVNDTGGLAKAVVWWRGPGALPENIRDNSKWWAQYWGNQWFEDQPPLEQNEATIDHDWNLDGPGLGVPSDNFSSRYTKTITFACGHYQFLVSSDDGYRLKLDGNIIGEKWIDGVWWGQAHQADITAGVHEIVLEHYEKDGAAAIHLSWTNVTPCAAPPGAFNKSSPANGTAGQPTNPTLVWGSSSGAANYEYCLDTTDNNTCDSAWTNIGNTTSKTLSGLNNGTQYYWQVRARNTAGTTDANAGAWWSFTTQTQTTNANLLKNPGFELDADTNTIPDNWGANTKFRRVGKPHIEGSYAGRLSATDDKAVTITQKILNLTAGTTYAASCQVNIPATTDAFTFKVQIRWYNSLNRAIRTDVIERTFTGKTNGWEKVTRDIVAPAGTASAQFQFVATSLNAKINVDDCSFTQK